MLRPLSSFAASRHKGLLARALAGSSPLAGVSASDVVPRRHLDATYRWLCLAQDATPDDGVAGWFELVPGRWTTSYPETTGYIVPTFLTFAEATGDEEARDRALRMADWGIEVQMDDGAVLSGLIGAPKGPAVFNTGQAIFGWIAAFAVAADSRYADAARSAADWLVRHQDEDGAWRRNLSLLTTGSEPSYNCRCAWALAVAGAALGEERYRETAQANCEWVLTQQNDAGWFENAAFAPNEVPLLHSISYVIEGLLGVYTHLGDGRYLNACRRAVDQIVALWRVGRLAGRLDASWSPTVRWRCPTGDAQLALVLLRLEQHFPGNGYRQVARGLLDDVARMQLRLAGARSFDSPAPHRVAPVVGAVPGSFPIWGPYLRFALPNWAAKFFLDALLFEVMEIDELIARAPGGHSIGRCSE